MIDIFREVAKEYITYSTGQSNKLFPRADSWCLYKLTSQSKYNNSFPPFQNNKDKMFNYLRDKLGKPDKIITQFYLVRHSNRSYQMPISNEWHGYIPLKPFNLVISNKLNLTSRQHLEDLSMLKGGSHDGMKKKLILDPLFFDFTWNTLPYVKEGDTYFYVEFD